MKGRHAEAAESLAKTTLSNPFNKRTWAALGRAFIRTRNFKKAIDALRRSTYIDTYQPRVFYDLAVAHSGNEDVPRTLFYLRRCISIGFTSFEVIESDDRFQLLHGDPRYENMVYHGPDSPY